MLGKLDLKSITALEDLPDLLLGEVQLFQCIKHHVLRLFLLSDDDILITVCIFSHGKRGFCHYINRIFPGILLIPGSGHRQRKQGYAGHIFPADVCQIRCQLLQGGNILNLLNMFPDRLHALGISGGHVRRQIIIILHQILQMKKLLLTHNLCVQSGSILRRHLHQLLHPVLQHIFTVENSADGYLISCVDLGNICVQDQFPVGRRCEVILQTDLGIFIDGADDIGIDPFGIRRHSLPGGDLNRRICQIVQGICQGLFTAAAKCQGCHGQPCRQPNYSFSFMQNLLHSVYFRFCYEPMLFQCPVSKYARCLQTDSP